MDDVGRCGLSISAFLCRLPYAQKISARTTWRRNQIDVPFCLSWGPIDRTLGAPREKELSERDPNPLSHQHCANTQMMTATGPWLAQARTGL